MPLNITSSELPLTIWVSHGYALGFFDVLVLDGLEETVQEACGEIA
jgi:hypothetical protein